MSESLKYPKLRPVEVHPATHQGQQVILLQDPLQLSGQVFLVHHPLSAALAFFDGQHNLQEIESSLRLLAGLHVDLTTLSELVESLDNCMLLETDAYLSALSMALEEYRQAEFRPALLSGQSYPNESSELAAWLDSFKPQPPPEPISNPAALIVPHLDYERGGQIYANVFSAGREALNQADLVVIIGTDHHGPSLTPVFTRQNYATPLGVAHTSHKIMDELQAACPETDLFKDELYHLGEHSIELALVWAQHILDGKQVEFLPVMAGSVHEYFEGSTDDVDDQHNQKLAQAFRKSTADRNVVMIASGDLAHIGPAFGGAPVTDSEADRLFESDMQKIDLLCKADPLGLLNLIRAEKNQDSICGSAPFFRLLTWQTVQYGHLVGYAQVDADRDGSSLVSACGIVYE